jgi:hypothetical protein
VDIWPERNGVLGTKPANLDDDATFTPVVAQRRLAPAGTEEVHMLWLILGVVLLVIAIAGGAIVHPVLFVLGLLALFMFFSGWRGRTASY